MAGLPSLETPPYRVQLFRDRFALSERPVSALNALVTDADLMAADEAAPVGTLQAFGEPGGGIRGRLSLGAAVDLRLTIVHAARLTLAEAATPVDTPETVGAPTAGGSGGRPTRVTVLAERASGPDPRFVRFALSGVTAPVVTKATDSAVTVTLGGGEYFFELRPAASIHDASVARALDRATHFTARQKASRAASE